MFIVLLASLDNVSTHTICVSLINQKYFDSTHFY